MNEKIEPALSAEEWRVLLEGATQAGRSLSEYLDASEVYPARQIALSNATLPDSDPRKITRHSVWLIRKLRSEAYIDPQHPGALEFVHDVDRLADALESYLPPE